MPAKKILSSVGQVLEEYHVVVCDGILHQDFETISFPPNYDFVQDYPLSLHSTQLSQHNGFCGFVKPTWNISLFICPNTGETIGVFTSGVCERSFMLSTNEVPRKTFSGRNICVSCNLLLHHPPLLRALAQSAARDYKPELNDVYCPTSEILRRKRCKLEKYHTLRLQSLNLARKVGSLSKRCGDNHRFLVAIQEIRLPNLDMLLASHLRENRSLASFEDKMRRASEMQQVGHNQYRRGLIPRHMRNNDGDFDDDFLRKADLSFLTLKLGNRRLSKASSIANGTFGARYTRRLIKSGVLPVHQVIVSPNVGRMGKEAIRKNMQAIIGPEFDQFLPEERCMVALMIDGVAVEPRVNVDSSVRPMTWTGLCRHCENNRFITVEDGIRIQKELNEGSIHRASEMEVICLGLIHPRVTSLIVIGASPTCKKDEYVGESTHTIESLLSTCQDEYYKLHLDKKIGPLITFCSDGAPAFRKGAGKLTSDMLPPEIRERFKDCLFFNFAGGLKGETMKCDDDHLGKRHRSRGKSVTGVRVGNFVFDKVQLSKWFALAKVVKSSADAEKLLNPDDNMDVLEMVRYLQAVKKVSSVTFLDLPERFRARPDSRDEFCAITLMGEVTGCLAAIIVGHHGQLDEEGTHMSVTEILQTASKFSFLLFFLFRKHRSNLYPNQHYRNCQDTVKNMFVAVAIAKNHGIKDYIFFLNTSKRLEQLFGITRSMIGGDLNFDCLGLQHRLGDAAAISQIYGRHPEWDSPPRKLTCSFDRKNCHSWKGDTKVKDVDVSACWNHGLHEALSCLRDSRIFTNAELSVNTILEQEKGVDILRPYRKTIGVLAGDTALVNLLEEEDGDDDEEEEDGTAVNGLTRLYYST
ncbi:hypothetical protein ACHAXR_010378 [Thalassiosira sp. AJA248-18]